MVSDSAPPDGLTVFQPVLARLRKEIVLPSPEMLGTPLQPWATVVSLKASLPAASTLATKTALRM